MIVLVELLEISQSRTGLGYTLTKHFIRNTCRPTNLCNYVISQLCQQCNTHSYADTGQQILIRFTSAWLLVPQAGFTRNSSIKKLLNEKGPQRMNGQTGLIRQKGYNSNNHSVWLRWSEKHLWMPQPVWVSLLPFFISSQFTLLFMVVWSMISTRSQSKSFETDFSVNKSVYNRTPWGCRMRDS